MDETLPNNDDLLASNHEVLKRSELGPLLRQAHEAATALEPALQEVGLVAIPHDSTSLAYATHAANNQSGRHEAHLRVDNLPDTIGLYERLLQEVPAMRSLLAEQLGIRPAQVTPQQVYVHSFLHELGHTLEYGQHNGDAAELWASMGAALNSLPLPGMYVSQLLHPDSPARKWVTQHLDGMHGLLKQTGTQDLTGLLNKQYLAYRGTTHESSADTFAADVLAANPQLLAMLLRPMPADVLGHAHRVLGSLFADEPFTDTVK